MDAELDREQNATLSCFQRLNNTATKFFTIVRL